MRLSRRGGPSVPSAEDAVPPRSTPDGGSRHGPPVPGRYRGLAGRRDDRARYPGAGGCLIPWRFRTRPESWSALPHRTSGRCRLGTGKLVLHVHGSGQSPRTCVHPEDRVALMERHPGLMGRPDPADGTDLLEENREGQDSESHGARSGSGPRARGTRWSEARTNVKMGQGPARSEGAAGSLRGGGYDGRCERCGTHSPRCGYVDGVVE